jgi:hypothetical protein
MARHWVGRMWLLLVCNGLASSVDSRLQSAGMFKNEYRFRVVSVPGIHKTSGFRHRSHYQDLNRMATAVKWRHTAPTASEDDEKTDTTEDEKTSAVLTTTAYFRRTRQRRMWFNGKIVGGLTVWSLHAVYRAGFIANIAQQSFPIGISSPNYNDYVQEHIYCRDSAVSCRVSIDFFVTSPMRGIYINKTTSSSEMCIHYSSTG